MINQVLIEGHLTNDAKIVDSKTNKDVCFVNFSIGSNKSSMKNGNWENVPFYFDASYLTDKQNPTLKRMIKGAHVLVSGYLIQERYEGKSIIKIKCSQIGLLPRLKNDTKQQNYKQMNNNYNNNSYRNR